MRRIIFSLLLSCFFWMDPAGASQRSLRMQDISGVMEKFFSLHISNQQLSPQIVRRSLKIYIENFDFDRSYLLEDEVMPYLTLSDEKAVEIMGRLERQDYSDFIALNQLMQKAIVRAEKERKQAISSLVTEVDTLDSDLFFSSQQQYPKTLDELGDRQKARMLRFFAYHQMRSRLDTEERKERVFLLYEKKIRRAEYSYLFLNAEGAALPQARIEHLMTLRLLKAFAKSLDTHTSFFSPEEAYEMRLGLEKQFEGVGVVLSEGIDGIMIADLIQGSPAELSGKIKVNDFLVEIDEHSLQATSFEEVMELLKKKGRDEIVLGFKRFDPVSQKEVFFKVPLKKRAIVMNDDRIQTSFERVDGGIIGKISLHSFYESGEASSEKDIKRAIREFRQHGELKGLVLDLRENSGGFLSQAVKVSGLFVSNGVIVISKYGQGQEHFLRNIAGHTFYNGPLVVLTSKMSASAAEIVAQALQDYGVALIVGDRRTFGKGSIQYQTVTDPSADIFFKVTVGRYYTVSGKSTQVVGVLADIIVPSQYAPYNIGEKFLEYPLPPDQVEAAYVDQLTDLDERAQQVFRARYLPYLQRVVTFWQQHLPELKSRSHQRLAQNPAFQEFAKRLESVRERRSSIPINTIDEQLQVDGQDLQMGEAVHIVKDMIELQEHRAVERAAQDFELLLPTGS